MSEHAGSAPTVRFGRLEQHHLILGLSAAQTACVALAMTIATAGLYTAGAPGFAATLPLAGPLVAAGLARRGGRPLLAWAPAAGHWALRRVSGQTRYLTRPRPRPLTESAGHDPVLVLPGDPARLRLLTGPATGAALVHDPHDGTLTAVLRVAPTVSFLLTDGPTQGRLVAGWGRLLAAVAARPALIRVQILERSGPAARQEISDWWQHHGVELGSWAAGILTDLATDAATSCERHDTLLAVTLSARRARGGRRPTRDGGVAVAVAALEAEMAALNQAVSGAELRPGGWLDPAAMARVVRTAYHPRGHLPAAPGTGGDRPVGGVAIGPVGAVETWEALRSDGAHHAVYWIAEWPRSEVSASFLQPLTLTPGVQRTFSITAQPLPVGRALRDIRRAKVEHAADLAQRARLGQVHDEAAAGEAQDVVRREQDLAQGHADLRFAGLLTVSADTPESLDLACGGLEQAATQAQCDLRRLYGQQGAGFAAGALPLARGLA